MADKGHTASLIPKSGFVILQPGTNKIVFSWQSEGYVIAKLNPDGTMRIINLDPQAKDRQ